MDKQEKITFIKDATNLLQKELLDKVDKMPEEWSGRELRQLVFDYAKEKVAYMHMDKKRKADYENDRIVRNI